jgi:hypothetical protein|tara:strand:- start:4809 stop:5183 length:375 start_codon:yes stop_codon:yes gene_type:complete
MANINENRKLMVENMKRVRAQLSESAIKSSDVKVIEKAIAKVLKQPINSDLNMAGAYEFYITDGEYMAFIGDGEDFGSDKKYAYSIGSPEDQVWDAESDDFKTAVKELVKAVSKYKKKMLEKQN